MGGVSHWSCLVYEYLLNRIFAYTRNILMVDGGLMSKLISYIIDGDESPHYDLRRYLGLVLSFGLELNIYAYLLVLSIVCVSCGDEIENNHYITDGLQMDGGIADSPDSNLDADVSISIPTDSSVAEDASVSDSMVPFDDASVLGNITDYNTGPVPNFCAKLEGNFVGFNNININIGDITITLFSWTYKEDEPAEAIGFSFWATDRVACSVKAGRDVFLCGKDGQWAHPGGISGPSAKAISNIVFCTDPSATIASENTISIYIGE